MKKPTATLSVRISYELWEKINEFAEQENADFSNSTRRLIKNGLWLEEHKGDIHDPEKANTVISEWTTKMNENEILDWPKTLSENQISAATMSLEMEKERRFKK